MAAEEAIRDIAARRDMNGEKEDNDRRVRLAETIPEEDIIQRIFTHIDYEKSAAG